MTDYDPDLIAAIHIAFEQGFTLAEITGVSQLDLAEVAEIRRIGEEATTHTINASTAPTSGGHEFRQITTSLAAAETSTGVMTYLGAIDAEDLPGAMQYEMAAISKCDECSRTPYGKQGCDHPTLGGYVCLIPSKGPGN